MSNTGAVRVRTLYPVDWIVLGYCLLMATLVALLVRPVDQYLDEVMFYLGMASLAALIIRYVDESAGGWRALVRIVYPALMFTFFYRVTGGQMCLLFDRYYDWQVAAVERAVIGENLTLYFDRVFLNVWATEILSFCYFCYYLMLPAFLALAFLRRDYGIIRQYLAAVSLTFFVSYLLFWLFPVEGPRWHFADQYINSIDGPVFQPLVAFVIDRAAVRGGAMPSSHTGVALVTLLFCFKHYRRAGRVLLPIVIGLALGAVWGRFHYVSDVIAGAGIGLASIWLVRKYIDQPADKAIIGENYRESRG